MSIVTAIIDKLKIKEIIGILFIASIVITFLPDNVIHQLKLTDFRNEYQTSLTICIIITGSYYLLSLIKFIFSFFVKRMASPKKIALNYMKNGMSLDEKILLVQTFYDFDRKCFRLSGKLNVEDGRWQPLYQNRVIYQGSEIGDFIDGFSFNLQPYALDFLNEQLEKGNIKISENQALWRS